MEISENKMAATLNVFDSNILLSVSASLSSVDTEKSDQEYTEDFYSSPRSSTKESLGKLSEVSTDNSAIFDTELNDTTIIIIIIIIY